MNNLKFIFLVVAIVFSTTLQAQKDHHKRDHHHLDKLQKELNLSEDQMTQLKEMSKALQTEMKEIKESDLPHDEMKEKFEAIYAKKKSMMDDILTEEQSAKMKELKKKKEEHWAERMEKKKQWMADKKPMMDEMKAYHENEIMPIIGAKRELLDKKLKRKDRKEVNKLREIVKEAMVEMKKEHEERIQNGEMKGKRPGYGKHKRGYKPMGPMGKKEMHLIMKLYKNNEDEVKRAFELSDKYADQIDELLSQLENNQQKWSTDLRAIKDKYITSEDKANWNQMRKGKGGKCAKNTNKGCCKSDKTAGCKEAPKDSSCCSSDQKRKKGPRGSMMGKMEQMKRVAFLLMPTEMLEEEVRREVNPRIEVESKVYPNPSDNSNTLEFDIIEEGKYIVQLYSKEGKLIKEIANEYLSEGIQRYEVDLSNLSTGSYYYIITDGKSKTAIQFIKN